VIATPPPLAERGLALVEPDPHWRDAILGDLREEFVIMAQRHGLPAARRWYWANALGLAAHRTAARLTRAHRRHAAPESEPPEPRAGRLALLGHDLRAAWRSLRHQPVLASTIVVVLALGLAANAAVFALADAIVLRPFRFPGVPRAAVVASDKHERFFSRESVAPGDFHDFRDQAADVFERLAAIEWWDPQYAPSGAPQQLNGFRVSPAFFEVLAEPAVIGRTLVEADQAGPPAVVIGYDFWQRQFARRDDVLGQSIRLEGVAHTVVGVMPPSFRAPYGSDVWAPLAFTPETGAERGRGWLMVIGRLKPGVTAAQAEGRLKAIVADQRAKFPDTHATREVSAFSYTDGYGDPGAGPFVAVWQVAAFVLLLVACANVANLLLARNTERQREFSLRLALGASGGRLASQLLVEGALVATAATVLALPITWASLGAIRSAFPDAVIRFVPGWAHLQLEPRTFLATAALAGAAVMLFALAPAWRAARQNVSDGLRVGTRLTDGAGRHRARSALAVCQIALTLALLVGAGLALLALHRVTEGPLGFDKSSLLVGRVGLPDTRYPTPESRQQLAERVIARLTALPAVKSAVVTSIVPYSGQDSSTSFWREDTPPRQAEAVDVSRRRVSPEYLDTLGIPLVDGRQLSAADRADTPPVAVVSQSLARRFWPDRSAIGQRFRVAADGPLITVVGVAGDVTQHWLVDPVRPTLYRPFAQDPPTTFSLMVKTATDPLQLTAGLRAAVQAEDPELPVAGIRSMEGVVEDSTVGLRFAGRTLGVIAAVSGVLAAVGIYSLMSFLAGRRTREMGVRMALGATRRDVVALTCWQAGKLIGAGVAVGLVLAFLVGRGLEAALFGVVSNSAPLALAVATVLALTALLASYVPARRVSRVDPTIALRAD
jgi:putative ABC transport system permease protein